MAKPSKKDQDQHLSQMGFSDLLAQFVGTDAGSNPMGREYRDPSMSILSPSTPKKKESQSKGNYDTLDMGETETAVLDDISDLLPEDDLGDDYDPAFDALIANAFEEDENVQLRNNLIALGRQYAIKGAEEETETSEVNRSFIKQEQQIEALLNEINTDSIALQRDIELLRATRSRSYKSMADLISAKVSMSNAKLAAIKELSAIQKTKYDISLKLKAAKNEAQGDSGYAASQAIQKLIGLGRGSLIGGSVEDDFTSGASDPGNAAYSDGRAETEIALARDLPPAETDGDKFIAHENEGVEYVLDINRDDDTRQIYAINKDGHVISDYPMPSNQEELSFSINEMAGEATDQLQRRYRLRYNGVDTAEDSSSRSDDSESIF